MKHRTLRLALIALLLAGSRDVYAQSQDAAGSSEYLIKAGFIYNFAKLVEWPALSSSPAIVIGVLGDDSVVRVIEDAVSGKKLDGRSFVVRRLKWSKDLSCGCQILFLTARESAQAEEIVQAFRGSPVLTISESPGLAKRGIMINFILENSQVRFEVNVEAARQAGLSVSSRLLSLAKIVQTDSATR